MNIIGRLTRDAQVATLASEKQVVNFCIAVNDSYQNKKGVRIELTEFENCAYWISPKIAPFLTKGTLVELTGRVSAGAWLGNDGQARASLNFHTLQIKFHGAGKRTETSVEKNGQAEKLPIKKGKRGNSTEEKDDLPF